MVLLLNGNGYPARSVVVGSKSCRGSSNRARFNRIKSLVIVGARRTILLIDRIAAGR